MKKTHNRSVYKRGNIHGYVAIKDLPYIVYSPMGSVCASVVGERQWVFHTALLGAQLYVCNAL